LSFCHETSAEAVDRRAMGVGGSFSSSTAKTTGSTRPPSCPQPSLFRRHLVILQTGAAWRFLPDEFPSPSTCWRRLKQWEEEGVWLHAWRALLGALDQEGLLKWDEAFLDGSFAPAKKGALPSAKPSGARARSGWYWSTVKVFRWEFGWKVPPPVKLSLRKPRSKKSAFRDRKAARGKSRSG